MSWINLYPYNILAEGSFSVSTELANYPKERLFDWSKNFYWMGAVANPLYFEVDQGASDILGIDFLAIENHNFDARTISWKYSDNGADWTNVIDPWLQSGNGQIIKTLDDVETHRYWQVTVSSVSSPQCAEVFMSKAYKFHILYDGARGTEIANVNWKQSYGALESSIKKGDSRKKRVYPLLNAQEEYTIASFREAVGYLDEYSRPFYIKDHEGDYWLCRLVEPDDEDYLNDQMALRSIEIIEMI